MLTAIGAGALGLGEMSGAAGVEAADVAEGVFAALGVEHAQTVVAVEGAVAAPVGEDLGLALGGWGIGEMEGDVELAAQLGGAILAEQAEVVLHGHRDGPALAAASAAIAAFTGKMFVIIRNPIAHPGFFHIPDLRLRISLKNGIILARENCGFHLKKSCFFRISVGKIPWFRFSDLVKWYESDGGKLKFFRCYMGEWFSLCLLRWFAGGE